MHRDFHYLFYAPDVNGNDVVLDESEARHAVAVLRLKIGDALNCTDGKGTVYTCRVAEIGSRRCRATIEEQNLSPPLRPSLRLFIGLPERDAFEHILNDCTPLGVARFTPVVCTFCQKRWWAGKWDRLAERFAHKCVAGMKLACYPYLPVIDEVVTFAQALKLASGPILVADQHGRPLAPMAAELSLSDNIGCFIGPPGGFSVEEVGALQAIGSRRVLLAATRLSTDIAAMALTAGVIQAAYR
jgi:16S rRNA (uracil1498-N3)-methyltransferase